eukprot:4280382-Pyramimonas_sp.AAC.1
MADQATLTFARKTTVLHSFGNCMAIKDHHPLQVDFQWGCEPYRARIPRCPKLDPRKMADADDRAAFAT